MLLGYTADMMPRNDKAHNAESDAIYIGQCMFFYKKLVEDRIKGPTVLFTSL
jgi:hypothetical protein